VFKKFLSIGNVDNLKSSKAKLVTAIDLNIRSSQECIDSVVKVMTDFRKHKYLKHDSFFNLNLFSDIVNIDLTIILERIELSERVQDKRLYARIISVIIVDYLDNINVLLGKDCIQELRSNSMSEFVEDFKQIHRKVSIFRKSHERRLRDIRNGTIAHRSKNALELLHHIENIDLDYIVKVGLEFKIYSKEFSDLSTRVVNFIADYMKAGKVL